MDPDKRAKLDQSFAEICDTWPPALWRFFKNAITEGFTEEQALILTINFMKSVIDGPKK